MKSWLAIVSLAFAIGLSLEANAAPFVGVKYCEPSLNACLKKSKDKTQCGQEYETCLKTTGGVLERSDGSMTQRYHPDNPQFKKCQAQGLIIGTKAFDACMNGAGTSTASTPRTSRPPVTSPTTTASTPSVDDTTPTPQEDPNTPESRACQAEFAEAYQKCEAESQIAVSNCDSENDSDLASFSNSTNDLAIRLGATAAASITQSCTEMAKVSQAANATVATFRTRCKAAQNSCFDSCARVNTFISERSSTCFPHLTSQQVSEAMSQYQNNVSGNRTKCEALDTKITEAEKAIKEYGNALTVSAGCREDTYGGLAANAPEFCKATPSYPGCSRANPIDCSDPTAAVENRVCICQKNPNDRTCTLAEQKEGGESVAASSDPSGRLPSQASGGGGGDMFGTPSITQGKPNSGGPGTVAEGRQGGEALGGSGGGSGNGGSASGRGVANAGDGNEHGVLGGFYGGGGGSYGAYGNGSGSGTVANANGAQRVGGNSASSQELQKFLPGGQNDRRYPNGASGPDGITGPHSNIWLKIQNRYQNESSNLMP
ncbi:hypothetical protein [uncultured Bdellovibrio sp.]|uniref:hypothetical protein n=1 Tax=Bdellovibrio sp. HCB-162 TaxID=3394234 RepID=UPI0025CBAA61|nr:hypothetical protein [uncultured Bdellovibrio sp.]